MKSFLSGMGFGILEERWKDIWVGILVLTFSPVTAKVIGIVGASSLSFA